jgi:hypothetical protein
MTHAWPCSLGSAVTLGEVPWLSLKRCAICGSLWEVGERSMHRITADAALSTFGIVVPTFVWTDPGTSAATAIHAHLNGGSLFRLVLTTEAGPWGVRSRGTLFPDDGGPGSECTMVDAEEAIALATTTWGASAGAVFRLAIQTDMDQSVFRALDLIQALPVEDWDSAWQPRASSYADVMLAAGPDPMTRIRTAVAAATARGDLADGDRVAAGLG